VKANSDPVTQGKVHATTRAPLVLSHVYCVGEGGRGATGERRARQDGKGGNATNHTQASLAGASDRAGGRPSY
jgi:hypothetical protein